MNVERVHFILYVDDPVRAKAFYSAVLGAEPTLDVPGMTEFTLPGGAILGLMPGDGIRRLLEGRVVPGGAGAPPRAELYLLMDRAADAHQRALQAGARVLSAMTPRDWGHDVAYCLDPEGHVLALARRS